jgi:hypothetical protein
LLSNAFFLSLRENSALMAHTAYWSCSDTALFILRACGPPTGAGAGAQLAA